LGSSVTARAEAGIGKDLIPESGLFVKAPSGTGCQLLLFGFGTKNPALNQSGLRRAGIQD
tara:strand:+ start:2672 stop:2851 length:180 start_codon:yes stop_codon:yes gene_type:complete